MRSISCMNLRQPLSDKAKVWKNTLSAHLSRSFRKVRVRKMQGKTSASDSLIDKRNKLIKLNEKESSKFLKELNAKQVADLENLGL